MFYVSDEQKKVLYNRFHSLKNRVAKTGAYFQWDYPEGFTDYCAAVFSKAEPGASVDTYQVRFKKEELMPGGKGYCEDTLYLHWYKSDGKVSRRKNSRDIGKKLLITQDEVVNLCKLVAAITLSLLETDSDPESLANAALKLAGVTIPTDP